jgi:hypothetical protein
MVKKCPKGKQLKKGFCVSKPNKTKRYSKSNGMKIFLGIALSLIFFGLFNLGVATFYDSPEYLDFCDSSLTIGGEEYQQCNTEYEQARDIYENNIFYIFVISGLILAVVGLFITSLPFQIVGLAGGTSLIIEGIMRNLDNKVSAFIAGVLVFGILSYFVWRKFK